MGCLKLSYNLRPNESFLRVVRDEDEFPENRVEAYRYGHNGMERDDEVKGEGNSYTTMFRQYDPRLGRWLTLDPLMAKFPGISPYVSYANNPIFYKDPYGLSPVNDTDPPSKKAQGELSLQEKMDIVKEHNDAADIHREEIYEDYQVIINKLETQKKQLSEQYEAAKNDLMQLDYFTDEQGSKLLDKRLKKVYDLNNELDDIYARIKKVKHDRNQAMAEVVYWSINEAHEVIPQYNFDFRAGQNNPRVNPFAGGGFNWWEGSDGGSGTPKPIATEWHGSQTPEVEKKMKANSSWITRTKAGHIGIGQEYHKDPDLLFISPEDSAKYHDNLNYNLRSRTFTELDYQTYKNE